MVKQFKKKLSHSQINTISSKILTESSLSITWWIFTKKMYMKSVKSHLPCCTILSLTSDKSVTKRLPVTSKMEVAVIER